MVVFFFLYFFFFVVFSCFFGSRLFLMIIKKHVIVPWFLTEIVFFPFLPFLSVFFHPGFFWPLNFLLCVCEFLFPNDLKFDKWSQVCQNDLKFGKRSVCENPKKHAYYRFHFWPKWSQVWPTSSVSLSMCPKRSVSFPAAKYCVFEAEFCHFCQFLSFFKFFKIF